MAYPPVVTVVAKYGEAVMIRWKYADGTVHEFMYTCPRALNQDARASEREERRCEKCGWTTLILQKFCGHCGAEFAEPQHHETAYEETRKD